MEGLRRISFGIEEECCALSHIRMCIGTKNEEISEEEYNRLRIILFVAVAVNLEKKIVEKRFSFKILEHHRPFLPGGGH
jgi:hypothetical protein